MSKNDGGDIVIASIGLFVGLGLFRSGFTSRQRYKTIERTPTSKIRSVAVGLVEVNGYAEKFENLLVSPFAQAECVYYSYKTEERRKSGKSHKWITIASDKTKFPFLLRDDTGLILIDPQGAECRLESDRSYRMSSFSEDSQERSFKAGLTRLGIEYGSFWGERPLRCTEIFIRPCDSLFILGTATIDRNRPASATNSNNLCIMQDKQHWFVISDHSEKDLLKSLWWGMYGKIIGGPVLTVLCLAYLLNRFHVR